MVRTLVALGCSLGIALIAAVATVASSDHSITDPAGRPLRLVAADGTVVEFVYDDRGRLVRTEYSDGRVVIYHYDENGEPLRSETVHE